MDNATLANRQIHVKIGVGEIKALGERGVLNRRITDLCQARGYEFLQVETTEYLDETEEVRIECLVRPMPTPDWMLF